MASPTRVPEPSSTHRWAGTSPRILRAPALRYRKPALASGQASPTRGQTLHARKPQSHSLQNQPAHQQARSYLGTSWASILPTSRPIQALGQPGHHHSHLYQELLTPTTSDLTPALGPLSPATRLQDLALPASSLALTPRPGFAHQ